MEPRELESISCSTQLSIMLSNLHQKLSRLCSKLCWPIHRMRSKPKIMIKKFRKSNQNSHLREESDTQVSEIHVNGEMGSLKSERPIRVATFNAAMFSMAPAIPPNSGNSVVFDYGEEDFLKVKQSKEFDIRTKVVNDRPKSILKQHNLSKSKLRVSINLPDNEISLERSRQLSDENSKNLKGKAPLFMGSSNGSTISRGSCERTNRTILEVLREVDADILALQDVKAEEEREMKPLSDLATALGMNYVFAESWAPEYGNAILSKWPIKTSQVQKIFDDSDFRNVLKATMDIPQVGEVNFHCTHLDHLDENWRMKQINAMIQGNDGPHILAGGLNSLDETDYSPERWSDIVKYYEEIGKPTPKVKVMKFLKGLGYVDAKDSAGECESVVMIAKGQNVQGTCKYGTRVDYILTSQDSPYKFIPGSYSVLSSKGTSDHHIVKVDILKVDKKDAQENVTSRGRRAKKKVLKMTSSSCTTGIWRINS